MKLVLRMALTHLFQQCWQVLFSILLFSLLFFLIKFINGSRKLKLPPSPPRLPIIGHLHLLGSLPHRSFRALSDTYGPVLLLHLGHKPTIVVSSAEIAKQVMKTQDIVFSNRVQTRAADAIMYGCTDLGFAQHGEYWRQMRRVCVLELLSHKRVQSFQFVREQEVAEMVKNINRESINGAAINLGEMLVQMSSSIVSRCVLGRKYEGEENKKRFGELARTAMELMGDFCFRDFFPYFGWLDVLTGLVKRLKDTSQGLDAFLDEVFDEYRNSDHQPDQDRKCLLEILVHLQEEGVLGIDITQDNFKAVLVDMFVGGTDTTSTTIEWAMGELMKNPTKMKKAQEEVRRVVGKKPKVDEEDINRMDYLKCVVKETLRLHPPVPFLIPRELTESAQLDGYDIPSKTGVFVNAWAIQRDPKLWDRPDEFLPERFDNSLVDFKGLDFHFIPFGAGRRGCPGMSFAAIVAEYVLANLLCWFDWKFPSGVEDVDMSEAYGLVVHKKSPLQLVPVPQRSPQSLK